MSGINYDLANFVLICSLIIGVMISNGMDPLRAISKATVMAIIAISAARLLGAL